MSVVDVYKPVVTARIAGVDYAVSAITLTAGFGAFLKAEIIAHPVAEVTKMDLDQAITELSAVQGAAGELGSISLTCGTDKLLFSGVLTGPGYAAARSGGAPGFSMKLVHETSQVAAVNLGIYDLTPAALNDTNGQNLVMPEGFIKAKTIGASAASVLDALLSRYADRGEGNTERVKNAIHKKNQNLAGTVRNFLARMSAADYPNWKDRIRNYSMSDLLTQLYNYLTMRSNDFSVNMTTLCAAFGYAWYSSMRAGDRTDALRVASIYAMGLPKVRHKYIRPKYAPSRIRINPPTFTTPTGLAPTHVVVESRMVYGVLADFHKPDSIVAAYPNLDFDENSRITNIPSPAWGASGAVVVPLNYPASYSIAPAQVDKDKDARARSETKQVSELQRLNQEWATFSFIRIARLPISASVVIPMDLSIDVGEWYEFSGDGQHRIRGLAWQVSHSLKSKTAETSIQLKMVTVL